MTVFVAVAVGAVLLSVLLDYLGVPDGIIALVFIGLLLVGVYSLFALKIANEWEKAVILRFGKFHGSRGPGLFWIIPIVDTAAAWVDNRIRVTPFAAEKTLTKDTVPVNVDAVLFWMVWDAQKAALEVREYELAVDWAAQTALRDIIGKMPLADILVGREAMDVELRRIIDERTTPWGVSVSSVEIRDVVISQGLEDAMSRGPRRSASDRRASSWASPKSRSPAPSPKPRGPTATTRQPCICAR